MAVAGQGGHIGAAHHPRRVHGAAIHPPQRQAVSEFGEDALREGRVDALAVMARITELRGYREARAYTWWTEPARASISCACASTSATYCSSEMRPAQYAAQNGKPDNAAVIWPDTQPVVGMTMLLGRSVHPCEPDATVPLVDPGVGLSADLAQTPRPHGLCGNGLTKQRQKSRPRTPSSASFLCSVSIHQM